MPRPGTPLIHPAMTRQVQSIAEAAMTDRGTVSRGGSRTFDETTMRYATAPGDLKFDGPCRIQPVPQRDHVIDSAGDLVTLRRYSISIPADVIDVQVDDHFTPTSSTDALLIGQPLRVVDITGGTYEGQRHLLCFDDLG